MWIPKFALVFCILFSAMLGATAKPLVRLDVDPGWELRPTYLGNPAAQPELLVAAGTNILRVSEPGRGMKWELPVSPFNVADYTYLIVRYKAENLASRGYALWAFDGSMEGLEIVNPRDLIQDGQWHYIAVDLLARGVTGSVWALVVEVQCQDQPAYLAFSEISLGDEAPAGAQILPAAPPEEKELLFKFAQLPRFTPQPDWLAQDAERYGIEIQNNTLYLWAEGADVGMKFSVGLPEPIELSQYRYAAIRYKARGLSPWGDYLIWLGSGGGGMPEQYAIPLRLNAVRNDGEWHTTIVPVPEQFRAVDMALQVCSAEKRGEIWLDYIRFSSQRPLLELSEIIAYDKGWEFSQLQQFRTLDLSAVANATMEARLKGNGLKSWLPPASKICVRGIPFMTLAGPRNILQTPEDINKIVNIPVGGKPATELYFLWLARLPATDAARMGAPVPMEAFRNPERFRVRVEYMDGLVEEMFPLLYSSQEYEVKRGVDVYCVSGLRKIPIKNVGLVNRMETGCFYVAAITINEGKPLIVAPSVQALPPTPKPLALPAKAPSLSSGIQAEKGGYMLQNRHLWLELQTEGGLAIRRLSWPYEPLVRLAIEPGPLFELGEGNKLLDSTQIVVGEVQQEGRKLIVPWDARPGGVPLAGQLVITVEEEQILMQLELQNAGTEVCKPLVHFPVLRGLKIGSAEDTWYLYCRKGGLLSNRPTRQRRAYGGEYPLQVADIFNPRTGGGLALLTYDLRDVYRFWDMTKDAAGVTWKMEYWQREYQPGEQIETVPTALRGHRGDWREALEFYRQWAHSWYKPLVPRKRWFQEVFYYQQALAWTQLRNPQTGQWRMNEELKRYKEAFGCLDYLHVFDFGQSQIYGRVGDYSHYEELGGLEAMRAAFKEAQDQGVRIGVYIEGYLCDNRGVWGREHVAANCIITQDGKPLMWPGSNTETMMCPSALPWREHLANTYKRVAAELQPDGMYIDQYGFIDTWKTCWSREHGHPVPHPPIRGEGETTRAIREAIPPHIANLTEETPNDVHAQYQDGALGYSVVQNDPVLAPHRVDLFRFVFPDFKVFQLVSYNPFLEGGWDLLKWPFFNGEAYWLHHNPQRDYCPDALQFMRRAFAILHRYKEAFCSADVRPLVPTLMPTVYANEFRSPKVTVWTIFNAEYKTWRGELLRVPHQSGTRYYDAFQETEIKPRVEKGEAWLPVTIGPRDVGCLVARRP